MVDISSPDINAASQETNEIQKVARLLQVLADEHRLRLVCLLAEGEKCVCQLVEFMDIPQNLASHHLRVLREHGLVTDERRGRWVYYSLVPAAVGGILESVQRFCDCSGAADSCAICPSPPAASNEEPA